MKILVTGGAGFIGSALIRFLIKTTEHQVINVDKLSYASNLKSLDSVTDNENYSFYEYDICNRKKIDNLLENEKPDVIFNLAAESHVDNSLANSRDFIFSNIIGTYELIESTRNYLLKNQNKNNFRFIHISTDEVFGDLSPDDSPFTETNSYKPSSPYSASKASSDHLVRSWFRSYGFPAIITNCSNNYGPYQYPEKLIPLVISKAIKGKKLPIYGSGLQIRDWLHVEDHISALYKVLLNGRVGDSYNIGGKNEKTNLSVVKEICRILDETIKVKPNNISSFSDLISFVDDRPGHDLRYAIDASKISRELDWDVKYNFDDGLKHTVDWYLDNTSWVSETLK